MPLPPTPARFAIFEDDTAQIVVLSSTDNGVNQEEDSLTAISWANNLSGLISKLERLKLDSCSSISRSRIVVVVNRDEGATLQGDGKPIADLIGGFSIEQTPDEPLFIISWDQVVLEGYYHPNVDDLTIHSSCEGGLEVASYLPIMDKMASPLQTGTSVSLTTGLWQISNLGQSQFFLYIFPKTYTFSFSSKISKRLRPMHEDNERGDKKRVRLARMAFEPESIRPGVGKPNPERAMRASPIVEASSIQMSNAASSMTRSDINLSICTIDVTRRTRLTIRNVFKLGSVKPVQCQSSSGQMLIGDSEMVSGSLSGKGNTTCFLDQDTEC
ncbi:hypothetical protein FSARC_9109 [Fusarium sarcochroum]|uniref:Uncharacterized protein n=1 Tax=Fusarium sarcochroum TaxID=1208366 RepID=A0A8H4TRJ6_9HYPO|nr:hypothetical protein FSARC_9109 [Fusarium sarcochroum]